jgi:spore protease
MKDSIDLSMYSVRTDLAVEAREMAIAGNAKTVHDQSDVSQLEGVIIKEKEENDIKISLVEITAEGEKAIGKKQGQYLTIEVLGIRQQDSDLQKKVEGVFASEFAAKRLE